MNNELLNAMKKDMKIVSYTGETDEFFAGRVVYSAICHWLRYVILDEMTGYRDYKSKIYILERGKELLVSYIEGIPECQKWLCTDSDGNEIEPAKVIKLIRERMLMSGEFLEVDMYGNIGLPQYKINTVFDNCFRVVGLSFNEKHDARYVGVTRIIKGLSSESSPNLSNRVTSTELVDWLKEHSVWMSCTNLDHFEFFNPYSKNPPYKSWSNKPVNGIDIHLARLSNYNDQKEYYLFKKNDTRWLNSLIPTAYTSYKETRKIILGLRKMCENQMEAEYSIREQVVLLNLFCRLPYREEHILETYCWPLKSITDKLNYVVPIELWNTVKVLIQNDLEIELKERL